MRDACRFLFRLVGFVLIIFAIALMVGCAIEICSTPASASEEVVQPITFIEVGEVDFGKIVYCKQTKVMYIYSFSSYNCGSYTLLVNADGSPMIWEGY